MDHQPRHIHNLPDELLSEILSYMLGPESKAVNGNKPHSNSSHANQPGETSDLDRFRLVCKRFMRIGTPLKFSRFVLRFSRDGFQRLEDLLDMQLACYVKTVTYMVRPFYQGSGTGSSCFTHTPLPEKIRRLMPEYRVGTRAAISTHTHAAALTITLQATAGPE